MSKIYAMPDKHAELLRKLRSDYSIPVNARLQNAFSILEQDLAVLENIQGVEGGHEAQGLFCFLPLLWCPLDSQLRLVRALSLHGRYRDFAEDVRAMIWDVPPGLTSLGLRLKAFYLDLSTSINPFKECQSDILHLLEELQASEDLYFQNGEIYQKEDVFVPSAQNRFSTLSVHDQKDRVVQQAIEYGLWDAALFIIRR